ncbi:MAG: ribose 5-phosphate isomerase B [Promethearchaeota archaeon]
MEQIVIASDHTGLRLKEKIKLYFKEKNIDVVDLGTHSEKATDYPDFAEKVALYIKNNEDTRGILICGTGIGMSIAANRYNHIYASLCYDETTAEMARKHNNSNVLVLGARTTEYEKAISIIDIWLKTQFEEGRHRRRLEKIKQFDSLTR